MTPSFKPCLLVPVYNPGPALTRTLAGLLATGIPVLVQDDGSDKETQAELARMKVLHPDLRLSRWDRNQGKGAAVCQAIRAAAAEGFTHALQVDADGQHDLQAIPLFLSLGARNPEAVIAGVPRYEGTVPPARRYGRLFTHAWVHLETLSLDIGDSLCGFRLYPLGAMVRLMDRVTLPARMDFDTAAIVRLHWQGTPVINAPVTVSYPEDGVSHFNLLKDNLRLTRMHTRLVFGMLLRFPILLGRRFHRAPKPPVADLHWSRIQERGTVWGLRLALWTYRLLGEWALRVVTEFVAAYFFLTGAATRRASRTYLRRLHETHGPLKDLPRPPGAWAVYRHVRAFAHSYVDRFLAWVDGSRADIAFPDEAAFLEQVNSGRGTIFLSAHLGNLDMLRGLGVARGLKGLNAVMYSDHVVRFQSLLQEINPHYELNLIHVRDASPATAMMLEEKISRGESLFIIGDRPPASDNGRTLPVPFLGKAAPFPMGPLFLAHLIQCPVFLFFCVKVGSGYTIHLERFADRITLPRGNREAALREWLEHYAKALEARCRATPLQWFNFYDFWADPVPESSAHDPHAQR